MVVVKYNPVKSRVFCDNALDSKRLYAKLDSELRYRHDGYFFMPAYQMGVWDGYTHFFSVKTGKFHSGFLTRVLKICRQLQLEVDVEGYPQSFPNFDTIPPITLMDGPGKTITLYEPQMNAVRKALEFSRGIWNIATNGGKTEITAGMIKALKVPPTLYVIPRSVLLKQTADRLEKRLGVKVGMVGGSVYNPNPNGITVAMFQSANLRLQKKLPTTWITNAKALFVDECQFLSDERYQNVVEHCLAPIRILMSGTVSRSNPVSEGASVGYGGPILAKVTNDDLVESGQSARANVLYLEPSVNLLTKHKLMCMDYREAMECANDRSSMIVAMARAFVNAGMQTMIMVVSTDHGRAIHELIPEATLTYANAKNRKDTQRRLQAGDVFACITTPIFDTGFDIPYIQGLIYSGGGSDEVRLAQSLGRLLRQNETRDKIAWFVDFIDSFHPVLKKHSRARQRYFKRHKTFNVTEELSLLPPEVYNFYMKEITGMKR